MQLLRYAIKQRQVATRQAGYEEAGHTLDKRQRLAQRQGLGAGGCGSGRGGTRGGPRFLCTSRTSASASWASAAGATGSLAPFPVFDVADSKASPAQPRGLRKGQKWHSSGSIPHGLRELGEGIAEAGAGLLFDAQALDVGVFHLAQGGSWQWYPGWRHGKPHCFPAGAVSWHVKPGLQLV